MRVMRLLLIGLVAALSGAAGAAVETPRLAIEASPSLRGGNTLIVTLDFPAGWQGAVDLRVPSGYTGTARPVPFGTGMSHLALAGVRPDGSVAQRSGGRVTVEDPARFAADCAQGKHAAVWLLAGELDEQRFSAPIFVDEGADGFRLRLCPDLRLGALRVTSSSSRRRRSGIRASPGPTSGGRASAGAPRRRRSSACRWKCGSSPRAAAAPRSSCAVARPPTAGRLPARS
jgi:hypothetical protein